MAAAREGYMTKFVNVAMNKLMNEMKKEKLALPSEAESWVDRVDRLDSANKQKENENQDSD